MKKVIVWQILGFCFTSVFGTLLHFLYDWFGGAVWIAPFSGVNESTWEHMKLFFWPAFIFAIFQSFFFSFREDFWCIKFGGIMVGLLLIPIIFYLYNGAISKSPDFINISIFFISALLSYLFETKKLKGQNTKGNYSVLALVLLCLIALLFFAFTFLPPRLNLFLDPLTNTYGILP